METPAAIRTTCLQNAEDTDKMLSSLVLIAVNT